MSGEEYLRGVLAKYAVQTSPLSPLRNIAQNAIYPEIQKWAGVHLISVSYSGSFAKGTANSCSNDLDLFISLKYSTQFTLKEMYESLYTRAMESGWSPRKQDVSIGIKINGHHIDLVPGRVQPSLQNWHSLYRNSRDSWTQTNVKSHIDLVSKSGRIEEIRLVKLWRHLRRLDFPSFLLELAVIESLKNKRIGKIDTNFSDSLEWISKNIQTVRLIDPANTNNIVSNDLTMAQKEAIAINALISRAQKFYKDIVW